VHQIDAADVLLMHGDAEGYGDGVTIVLIYAKDCPGSYDEI
jgi:hypothetical protein